MSRSILSIILIMSAAIASYGSDLILSEDWSSCTGETLPEGWSTVGTDKQPAGDAAEYFAKGEGMKIMTLPGSDIRYAVSYSSTVEGGKVNTRLISPEIEVPATGAVLAFKAVNYNPGSTSQNKVCVYAIKSDETQSETDLEIYRVPANNVADPSTFYVSLASQKGTTIRIAIANEGTDNGLLGLTSIQVAPYFATVNDATPYYTSKAGAVQPAVTATVIAPCNGYSATLTSTTGINETIQSSADLSGTMAVYELKFKKSFSLNLGDMVGYTISFLPNIEGAEPTVVESYIGCGEGYPTVCVEEEGTGEKCGYCPAGIAGIEKFTDAYPDRFIGIGIHCTSFSTGVMENHNYSDPFISNPRHPIESLPAAVLNRSKQVSPTQYSAIEAAVKEIVKSSSAATVNIDRAMYDEDSHDIEVTFTTKVALPYPRLNLSAAAVLLADGLVGSNVKWYQYNYFSGTSKEKFLENATESWWEYMQFFCEYPATRISPSDFEYNHVAMGIYPDYYGAGCPLKCDWSDGEGDKATISFAMPMQEVENEFGVQDPMKTSVVVMIINDNTGEIVAADKIPASRYNDESGVKEVEAAKSNATVAAWYSIDGRRIDAPQRGVNIAKRSDGTTKKVLF